MLEASMFYSMKVIADSLETVALGNTGLGVWGAKVKKRFRTISFGKMTF
jgi:hypothetical protein